MFVLKQVNIVCRQQMTAVNVLQNVRIVQLQIGILSWKCSMDFTGMLCLQIYYGLLLKEYLPRTQEKLERACLEHHCERSEKLCDWSSTQVSLFLLTGEAGIVNVQDCGMHWYLGSLAS